MLWRVADGIPNLLPNIRTNPVNGRTAVRVAGDRSAPKPLRAVKMGLFQSKDADDEALPTTLPAGYELRRCENVGAAWLDWGG